MSRNSRVKYSGVIVPNSDLRRGQPEKRNKKITKIATWNVRSLLQCGKLDNVKMEMRNYEIDILGISEMKWPDAGDFWSEDFRIIHTGSAGNNTTGVGIILSKPPGQKVKGYIQISDRIIMVKISSTPTDMVIMQVYMPTSGHAEEEIDTIYSQINEALQSVKASENLIILGDWNAVVGKGEEQGIVGPYGCGVKNERGEKLIEFCAAHKLIITNTCFQHHPRRIYTWKMPGDIARYQIDYILVKQRFKNQVKDSRSFPGADINSDHNLVIAKCQLKFKKLNKEKVKRWPLEKLRDEEIKSKYEEHIDAGLISDGGEQQPIEEQWNNFKLLLLDAADQTLGKKTTPARKPWVTEEIRQMILERKTLKSLNTEESEKRYKVLRNTIIRECKKAKEHFLQRKCNEVDCYMRDGKTETAYKLVKTFFGDYKKAGGVVEDNEGKLLLDDADKAICWKKYLERLYGNKTNLPVLEDIETIDSDNRGETILKSEFMEAVKNLKQRKSAGIDNISPELIIFASPKALDTLFQIISNIYETGEIPSDFRKSIIIPIPKKTTAKKCEDHRTISLLSVASKILTKIIYRRMERLVDETLAPDQFGFRKNSGTREAILALRILIENRMLKDKPTYIAFIDLEKAFDSVLWDKMMMMFKVIGVKYKDRRILWELYNQQVAIITCGETTEQATIGKGVRQGCNLSPLIFNAYIEQAIKEIKEHINCGVKIQGEKVSMLRYADDIAVLSESKEDLEKMLETMEQVLESYGLKINKSKTKIMVCGNKEQAKIRIKVGNQTLEELKEFNYLGSKITKDGKSAREIKHRIHLAKLAFSKKKTLLAAKNISIDIRKQFLTSYVWNIALYGCETWTIATEEKRRLQAFELWCYRRMLRIRWIDRVTNEEILRRINSDRKIIYIIKQRRNSLLGHLIRHQNFLLTIIEGQIEGKNKRGRPRLTYINNIKRETGCNTYAELKELAMNRSRWRAVTNQSQD